MHEPLVEHYEHRHYEKDHRPLEKFEFEWHTTAHPSYHREDYETVHFYAHPHGLEEYQYMPEQEDV